MSGGPLICPCHGNRGSPMSSPTSMVEESPTAGSQSRELMAQHSENLALSGHDRRWDKPAAWKGLEGKS